MTPSLPVLMATLAVGLAAYAFGRNAGWSDFSAHERHVAVYVVLIVGWPQVWTFFVGPEMWSTAEGAGFLYPTLWYLPGFVFAVVYFGRHVFTRATRFDIPAMVQYSTLLIALVFIALGPMSRSDVAKLAIPMGLLLVTLVKPSEIRGSIVVGLGCRASLLLITGSVLAAVVLNPGRVLEPCRIDKCSLAGQTLTSPFAGNGNILGLAVVMIVPFAVAQLDLRGAMATLASVVATIELAGSRTAEIGIITAAVLVLAIWSWPAQRRAILLLGACVALAFSLVPAIYPFGGTEFTFRGALWSEARQVIAQHPILGSGPNTWFVMRLTSIYDLNYSPHNGWLDVTLSIGLSGVIVLAAAVVLKLLTSEDDERDVLLLYLATLFSVSALESVYVPYILAILPSTCVLPFLGGPGRPMWRRNVQEGSTHLSRQGLH
ncbi:O-antigen ligase family protein [Mycobacterium yunnanensis]|uniref:O-antigen ligase family protein n=1 Tax=Mycobacterium yunnanensis TaxID=368477 RepID=A0A9X2YM82_9MYCO|nr:O-antigen ligase family protein [Mycobacterium yunnanensis]MCV7421962.1 O-antigen ligase family protein [Mycobacterium yunnanensis]